MKKIILLSISYFIGLQVFAQRSNCTVSPEANTIIQKDGSKITLVAYGNEQESYIEFFNENGYMVFTELYHKLRGYCCNSGCKHCPYGFKK